MKLKGISSEDTKIADTPNYLNISKLALDFSDGIIHGSPSINKDVDEYIKKSKLPVLDYKNEDEYIDAYSDFYDKIL